MTHDNFRNDTDSSKYELSVMCDSLNWKMVISLRIQIRLACSQGINMRGIQKKNFCCLQNIGHSDLVFDMPVDTSMSTVHTPLYADDNDAHNDAVRRAIHGCAK